MSAIFQYIYDHTELHLLPNPKIKFFNELSLSLYIEATKSNTSRGIHADESDESQIPKSINFVQASQRLNRSKTAPSKYDKMLSCVLTSVLLSEKSVVAHQ